MTPIYYSYRDIADELRRQITSGELWPGAALPAGRVLCERYGVSRHTIAKAMLVLRTEGLVVGHQGKAVYATADQRVTAAAAQMQPNGVTDDLPASLPKPRTPVSSDAAPAPLALFHTNRCVDEGACDGHV